MVHFSNFSGYDRLIVVIRGGGLLLNKNKLDTFKIHNESDVILKGSKKRWVF